MRKVNNGEKKEKRMMFIVATDLVASRPPERQPTGAPHTRAKTGRKTLHKDNFSFSTQGATFFAIGKINVDRTNSGK